MLNMKNKSCGRQSFPLYSAKLNIFNFPLGKKKGLILTLDAIFAIIAAMAIITASLYYTAQVSKVPYNKQALNRISQDTLTILEKDDTFKNAIETDSNTSITLFLDALPDQICARIDLKSSAQSVVQSSSKTNCVSSDESVFVRRSFVNGFSIYYAEIEAWYVE